MLKTSNQETESLESDSCSDNIENSVSDHTSNDDEDEDSEVDQKNNGNPAWADCISNVLSSDKPKTKKSLILSRAKKFDENSKVTKSYDFEIEGEIKEEKPDKDELTQNVENFKKKQHKDKVKTLNLRVKPSIKDREREKTLKKIATKGVVQLFNAVRQQQKELKKELENAGRLDHKKDAVLNNINKRKFLDVLMGGKRSKSEFVDNPVKDEIKDEGNPSELAMDDGKSEWNVLRDDFMTNKKLKHWDQESSDGESNEKESNDSDTDNESN